MNSNLALKLYAMIKAGIIKSNAHFWREFSKEKIENFDIDTAKIEEELNVKNIKLVCAFDEEFPKFDFKMRNSERPFLFLCKGDTNLLKQTTNNVAVIGVLNPTKDIEKREQKIVEKLVAGKQIIVSGLALGCDTIAHKTCLERGGKTIAILPTTFDNIYPKENAKLVGDIVESGGLVITEYVNESQNRFERIKRFVERDRLQAMLSKAVVLIASFRQSQGDSGSRHAMQKAKEYGKQRFVMFNEKTDTNQDILGLNQDLFAGGVTILTENSIKEIKRRN